MTNRYTKFTAVIKHIPKLTLEEARDIFVREISKLGQISNVEDEVEECVNVCVIYTQTNRFGELDHDSKCYHPLMLKSSAASITHFRRSNVDLKSRLIRFLQSATAVDNSDAWKTAFEMLDITYGNLQENEKELFLDLALFYKVIYSQSGWGRQIYTWIQTVHWHLDKDKLDDILSSLEHLSFVAMENNLDPLSGLRLHGLMVDFSMYKIKQDTMGFEPRFLLLDNGTQPTNSAYGFLFANASTSNEWPSESNALKSVRTISVSRYDKCHDSGAQVLEQLDLRNFEGVEVLHLVNNPGLHEVLLSCNTIAHLRSFIVRVGGGSVLRCTIDECWPMRNGMMTGERLRWVELEGNIIFSIYRKKQWWEKLFSIPSRRPVMDGLGILQPFLHNLQYLGLSDFPAESINLTTYTNLKELYIHECGGLSIIDVTTCINLEKMTLEYMRRLMVIRGLETLTNLKELYIHECGGLRIINVTTCINVEKMTLNHMRRLRDIRGLETLNNLKELYIFDCGGLSIIDVTTCINLEKMTLKTIGRLRVIHGLETLTNLKELDIFDCGGLWIINVMTCINLEKMLLKSMGRLRVIHGLETLINLKELDIFDCGGVSIINVTTCINFEKMTLKTMRRLTVIHGLETLTNLKELDIFDCGGLSSINVTTCTNLEKMKLVTMRSLSVIHGLEGLTNLKELDIFDCGSLEHQCYDLHQS